MLLWLRRSLHVYKEGAGKLSTATIAVFHLKAQCVSCFLLPIDESVSQFYVRCLTKMNKLDLLPYLSKLVQLWKNYEFCSVCCTCSVLNRSNRQNLSDFWRTYSTGMNYYIFTEILFFIKLFAFRWWVNKPRTKETRQTCSEKIHYWKFCLELYKYLYLQRIPHNWQKAGSISGHLFISSIYCEQTCKIWLTNLCYSGRKIIINCQLWNLFR